MIHIHQGGTMQTYCGEPLALPNVSWEQAAESDCDPCKSHFLPDQEVIEAVKRHALEHYEDGGWDVIVECYSDTDLATRLAGHRTAEAAIESLRSCEIDVWSDRQADARNSAF